MKSKRNNIFVFSVACFLIVASLSFFSLANENNNDSKSIFEDFDGDGLSNSEEEVFGTDPNNKDSDGDGYSDGVEIESGYDPLKPASLGDKIVDDNNEEIKVNSDVVVDDKNLTQKFSQDLIDYMKDSQESGKSDLSSDDLNNLVSKSLKENVSVENIKIDVNEFKIKKQDYSKLSKKKKEEKEKEDAIEYFTAISYVFMTNFPDGFFDRNPDEFMTEIINNAQNFSTNLNQVDYFEDLAKNAVKAEEDLKNIEVPESLVEIHYQGIYLLRYIKSLYSEQNYKNVDQDALSMLVTLTKVQNLLEYSTNFVENVKKVMDGYDITDQFIIF